MAGRADIFPYPFIHPDRNRPNLVKQALENEMGFSDSDSGLITAFLYGFESWNDLKTAYGDPNAVEQLPDEKVSLEERRSRFVMQAMVFSRAINVNSPLEAATIVRQLVPTASEPRPSLKGHDEYHDYMINALVDAISGPPDYEEEDEFPDDTPDPEELAQRSLFWLGFLMFDLQWFVRGTSTHIITQGIQIGETTTRNGIVYPVFLSIVDHVPDQELSDDVLEMMQDVADDEEIERAVILLGKPNIHVRLTKGGRARKKMLFSPGWVYEGGEWWEFVAKPNMSFEDVLTQKGKIVDGKPSKSLVKEFESERALSMYVVLNEKYAEIVGCEFDYDFNDIEHEGWVTSIYI